MNRTVIRWALAGILTLSMAVGSASAQFMPGFRPGLHWQNPVTGQRFSYNFNYNTAFNLRYVNPVTGQFQQYNFQSTWTGLPPSLLYPRAVYNPYGMYATPYISGGAGTYYRSNSLANPFVKDQVRLFAGAGDANQPVNRDGGRVIADQADYERRAAAGNRLPVPATVNQGLLEPTDEGILSGHVLNELLTAIRELESKGAKADAALLPAELLTHINLAGGPNADVLLLLKGGKPTYPALLDGPGHAAVRADLEKTLAPVVEALAAGKRATPEDAERLAASVRKARTELAPAVRDAAIQDGTAVVRFLNGLDALARSAREPSQSGLFPPTWSTIGASVAELVRHMTKFELAFSPATAGGEDAYYSLHRGFSTYYVALSRDRR